MPFLYLVASVKWDVLKNKVENRGKSRSLYQKSIQIEMGIFHDDHRVARLKEPITFGHLFVSGFAHLIPLLSGLNSKKQEPQIVVNGVTGGHGGSNYNNLLGKSTEAS